MRNITFNYIVYGISAAIALILLASSCSSPEKTMNFFTPDRLGYGIMDAHMNMAGTGKISTWWDSQVGELDYDLEGDSQTTMIYLEWDLPTWEESDYDRYLRDRVRQLSIELEMINRAANPQEEDVIIDVE